MNCIYGNHTLCECHYYQDYVGNKVCLQHYDNIFICHSCGKFFTSHSKGKKLDNKRFACDNCLSNEVNEQNIESTTKDVIQLLNNVGFDDILYSNAKYRLVSQSEMDNQKQNAIGLHYGYSDRSSEGRFNFDETILILDHHNNLEFRQIIAHELLHSWQIRNNLNEYNEYNNDELNLRKCEGFAQMGSYLVYSEVYNKMKSQYAEYKMNQMESVKDSAYGVAFKSILNQFNRHSGLKIEKWHYIIRCARLGQLDVK